MKVPYNMKVKKRLMVETSLKAYRRKKKKTVMNHDLAKKYLKETNGILLFNMLKNIQIKFNKIATTNGCFNTDQSKTLRINNW